MGRANQRMCPKCHRKESLGKDDISWDLSIIMGYRCRWKDCRWYGTQRDLNRLRSHAGARKFLSGRVTL